MRAHRGRSRGRAARLLALALSLALPFLLSPGPSSAEPDTKAEAEAQVERIQDQMAAARESLSNLRSDLNAAATRLAEAEFGLRNTRDRLAETREQLGDSQARFAELREQLNERTRLSYMGGPGSSLEFLFGSSSLSDLSDRLQFLNAVSEEDADLATKVANEHARLEFLRNDLSELEDKQAVEVKQAQQHKEDLTALFAQQADLLDQLQDREAEAKKLVDKFDVPLPVAVTGGGGGGVVPGGSNPFQACPVPGGGISNSFGAPRTGHLHMGVDIFAPKGAPIQAPFAGTVTHSTSSDGGLQAYLHGSQGWVFNAHLSSKGAGGSVSAGDVIGYVGDTGNAQGTSPHDHFEWHPNVIPSNWPESPYGYSVIGDAVNPYPILVQVC